MNIFKRSMAFTALALFCFAILPSCGSGDNKGKTETSGSSVELKLNFKPGDKYLYTTSVEQKVSAMGSINMNQKMVMDMVYSYSGEEGNNKKLDISYDHVLIDMTTPMGPVQFDSKTPESGDPGMAFMKELIGKSFSLTVAPNGDIVKIEGLDKLVGAVSSSDPETKAAVESQFSDTAVRLMMQNSFDLYPGKPVKPGETWGKKSVMAFSGINVNVENTYTLKSVANGEAVIGVTSIMNLPKMKMKEDQADMQMEMTGKQEGDITIEVATGRIISGKTNQVIKGNISAAGREVPMDISGTISISSTKQ